ncbi:Glycerate kinase [Corynebacterium ciconiae DSM 44920]|uniref:glycerate kinase n=1 Tax=Corynebacterium ciconiae TaxID=227319 RepID=UPI00036434BE|nr:glycerate kinase [Corynebacterium ciconiae]WKD61511.1 Glycerate kinase [Corynebacterium ciconiae DSM 44920]
MTVRPMTFVLAPDSFKGTATAHQACEFLSAGICEVLPDATIIDAPMADGGEGTSSLFAGSSVTLPTTSADGMLIDATYTFIPAHDKEPATAVIDVAAASGLPGVGDKHSPLTSDTFGTGVLIADAVERGAQRIVLGLGGSATVDGGTGILVALGATPMDHRGYMLRQGGGELRNLDFIDTAQLNVKAAAVEWVLLADVTNPATGPKGAAAVFGPQKGASAEDVDILDAGISRLCTVCDINPTTAGFGAAGAIPVGLSWLSRLIHGTDSQIQLQPGAPFLAAQHRLAESIAAADVVVTGEGRVDETSFGGKVVGCVTELAATADTTAVVVCGSYEATQHPTEVYELAPDMEVAEQMRAAGRELARTYMQG